MLLVCLKGVAFLYRPRGAPGFCQTIHELFGALCAAEPWFPGFRVDGLSKNSRELLRITSINRRETADSCTAAEFSTLTCQRTAPHPLSATRCDRVVYRMACPISGRQSPHSSTSSTRCVKPAGVSTTRHAYTCGRFLRYTLLFAASAPRYSGPKIRPRPSLKLQWKGAVRTLERAGRLCNSSIGAGR